MSLETPGLVAISVTIVGSIWVVIRFWQSLRDVAPIKERASSVRRHATPVLGLGMLIYSAIRMRSGDSDADMPDIFAAALIVLTASATLASWEMLLRISRFPGRTKACHKTAAAHL